MPVRGSCETSWPTSSISRCAACHSIETDWCRLRIDPAYAKRALDEADFDIYVTLRCNVVTGTNGLAVDGNFLAVNPPDGPYRMEFPTGDNTPGGTFESWFSVRRAGRTT